MTTTPIQQQLGVRQVEITADMAGQRVDNFLLTYLKNIPRGHVYRLIRKGEVRVNKKRVKPDYKLQEEDVLRVPPVRQAVGETPSAPANAMQKLADRILYEDDNVIVLNKPSGMAVHGGSGVRYGVIEALRQRSPKQTLELVHRLDRDTSGCLLIAKKKSVLRELHKALREHEMTKSYTILVKGHWPKRLQHVDLPLRKNELRSGERMVSVSDEGKEALTYFQVKHCYPKASLVEARIVTGRTHQIRVHAAHAGHPIAGDEKYGDKTFNQEMKQLGLRRIFLHAHQLKVNLPEGSKNVQRTFTAPLDDELLRVLQCLEGK